MVPPSHIKKFDLDVARPKILWRQVADQFRTKILKGDIPPGAKLPSTAIIATQSGTDVKTVHRAMTDLVREGLVTRARKVGTYVIERKAVMSPLGVYYPLSFKSDPSALFLRSLDSEIHQQTNALGIATRVFVDQRPGDQHDTVPPELERAAREREILGVIVPVVDPRHLAWLKKLPIPVVAFSGGGIDSCVNHDQLGLLDITLQHLKEKGCGSVGMIVGQNRTYTAFHERYVQLSWELGLKTRQEWVICPESKGVPGPCHESFGYEAFNQLWSRSERPEGLIVFPDGMARGVIMAIMAKQVRVPEDLHLVLHKVEEVGLFCPLKADFVVSSTREVATGLISQLQTIFRGRATEPLVLDFRIEPEQGSVTHRTAFEGVGKQQVPA